MKVGADDLRIRAMREADIARVQEIARALAEAPHWPDAAYLAAIDNAAKPVRIALVGERANTTLVVGFTIAQLIAPEAELETIAVTPEAQGCGAGRKMLLELVERLKAEGLYGLNLEVRASNGRAIGFYRAFGFQQTGLRPRYYSNPEEDAVLFRLDLR